ncbi:MAG: nickel-dependent hydrogenase large subunit [Burkholderiales bacterium]
MSLEGELIVRVLHDARRVVRTEIRSTRPFVAARLLEGQSPAYALATVPRLFSVCGVAQGAAAARALAEAGAAADHDDDGSGVMLEAVREYFRRLLIDAPGAMDEAADAATVAAVGRQRGRAHDAADALAAIAAERVYGMPAADWLALPGPAAFDAWLARGETLPARLVGRLLREAPGLGRSDVPLMPATTRAALERAIVPALGDPDAFAQAPTWDGVPAETGPLARMRAQRIVAALRARDGNSVATRMVARLAELAMLLEALRGNEAEFESAWVDGVAPAPNEGLAAVQTARGLLLHRARVVGDRVVDYRIVAPTEWNFHPDGALARGLAGIAADDAVALERRARLVVHALDPCVACRIEVGHA